jgi:site-specific DNA recombinase
MTSPFSPGSPVAAYLRDSGGSEQEQSLESQERAIRAWCQANDLRLSIIFRDSASGTSTAGREGFLSMMDHFTGREKPPERGVILWSFSRFAREINDSQYYKAELRRRGFLIHSMTDNVPEGLEGRLIESILEWKDAKFSADLSVHVKRGMRDLVQLHGGVPGTPPRGFKREPVEIGRHRDGSRRIVHRWVPDDQTWEDCRRAWELRISGASYRRIMDELPHLYRSANCYKTFFNNPIYKGELHFGDLVIPEYVKPMVSVAEWDLVQSKFRSIPRGKRGFTADHPRRAASSYALSGLAFCGLCGAPLSGNSYSSPKRSSSGKSYSCTGKLNRRDCEARNIPKDALESVVIREVRKHILTYKNIEAAQVGLDDTAVKKELQDLKRERGKRKLVVARLVKALAYVDYSDAVAEKLKITEAEIREYDRHIQAVEEMQTSQRRLSQEEIREMVSKLLQELITNDPVELRRVLGIFIKRIEVVRTENQLLGSIFYAFPIENMPIADAPKLLPLLTHAFAQKIKLRHHKLLNPI